MMRDEMSFYAFLKKYQKVILLALIFSFIAFGTMILYPTLSIDEEMSIFADSSYKPWIIQGRYGIQFLNLLFTIEGRFVPVLWDITAIFFWGISGVILAYVLFFSFRESSKISLFVFLAYYSSLPFVEGEILGFSMMSPQVGIGMISTAMAMFYTKKYLESEDPKGIRRKNFIVAAVLLFIGTSIYQAIITLYVTAFMIYCLQKVLNHKINILRPMIAGAGISVVALVIYYIINEIVKIIYNSQVIYIDNYIGWKEDPSIIHAAFMVIANVARVSFAITIEDVSIYGGLVIRITSIIFILWAIFVFVKAVKKEKIRILFLTIMTMIAPFSIYIVLGTYKTQGRMLLALQLVGAAALYYLLEECLHRKQVLRYLSIACAMYLLFLNARNMNTIHYYSYLRYEHDREIANQIMYDIKHLGYDYHKKSVVFIGACKMDFEEEDSSSNLGAKGSFFSWDDGNIKRMQKFIKTEGYNLKLPNKSQMKQALRESKSMKKWPQEGSIKETNNSIIVNLSKPTKKWYITNELR